MGERAAPITLAPIAKYAPKKINKNEPPVRRWYVYPINGLLSSCHATRRITPFTNGARSDGLLLRHWRREQETAKSVTEDIGMVDGQDQDGANNQNSTPDYPFAKYNLQVEGPKYNMEQYEENLKSEDWTKEETDYLIELYSDHFGKWPVIVDRYEFVFPISEVRPDGEPVAKAKDRTMEDLKARFYEVSAKMMAVHTPVTTMTAKEFETHQVMLKFNPVQEAARKSHLEPLLRRSREEKKEEEYLVSELRRIVLGQDRLVAELKEVRERLDHSLTKETSGAQTYESSQELHQLFQKLVNQDKNKKRRPTHDGGGESSPANGGPSGSHSNTGGANGNMNSQKRGSIAQVGPEGPRIVSPREEVRFGVTSHDRLTSGATLRSDKLAKIRAGKSVAQTQKIASLLAEVEVPLDLQMPTVRVCGAMERLVGKINLLLDARRVREKEENELAIARQKRGLDADADADADADGEVDIEPAMSQAQGQEQGDAEGEDVEMAEAGGADGEGEAEVEGDTTVKAEEIAGQEVSLAALRNGKRSASVMSTSSASSKRRKG